MEHGKYLVDLVDQNGTVTGTKQRREINKSVDLYHTVFVLLRTTDNELILSKIPERKDLPNIYSGYLGATAATIRRHDETPDEASLRAVKNELLIEDMKLEHIDDTYIVLPDGHNNYMSVYCGTGSLPQDFNHSDIAALVKLGLAELNDVIHADELKFAPTFLAIWQKYQKRLLPA